MAPARGMGRRRTGAGLVWALVMSLACSAAWSRPLVAFTRPPDQAAINGPTPVEIAYRSDSVRPIVRVELLVDGREAQADLLPSPLLEGQRNLTFNTAGLAPGPHRLTARAIDAAGEVGTAEITVNLLDTAGGAVDRIPPAVSVYYPAHGSTVSGRVTIRADVTDSSPLRGVFFYVDGNLHTVLLNTRPYEAKWDTTRLPDGPHVLEARAKDAAGNEGVSAPVTVVVQNTVPSGPQPVTAGPGQPSAGPVPPAPGAGGGSPLGPTVTVPTVGSWSPGAVPTVVAPPAASGPTVVTPSIAPANNAGTGGQPEVAAPARPAPPELAGPPAAWLQLVGAPVAPPVEVRLASPPSGALTLAAAYIAAPSGKLNPAVEAPAEAVMPLEATAPRPAAPDLREVAPSHPALPSPAAVLTTPGLAPVAEPQPAAVATIVAEEVGVEPSRGVEPMPPTPAAVLAAAPVRVTVPGTATLSEPTEAVAAPANPAASPPEPGAISVPPPQEALPAGATQVTPPGLAALAEGRPLSDFALAEMATTSGPQAPTEQPLRPTVALYTAGPRPVLPDIHLEAAAQGPLPAPAPAPGPAPATSGPAPAPTPTPASQPTGEPTTAITPPPTTGHPALRRLGGVQVGSGAGTPTPGTASLQTHRLTVSDAPQLAGAKVMFEGKELGDAGRPELIGGVLMVPIKALVEAADGALYWFANDRTARAVTPQADMTVKVGSDKASVNGEPRDLACAPVVKNGRLMVPLNLAADVLGVVVELDPATQQVILRRP